MNSNIEQQREDVANFAHSLPTGLTKEDIYLRIHQRAAAASAARIAALEAEVEALRKRVLPTELVPKWAGEFVSFENWVKRAQRALSGPSHSPAAICVDAKGRRCHIGSDFRRAHEEGAFPVRFFWECEAAPAAPAVAAAVDGWIENTGAQPVADDVLVDIELANGQFEYSEQAGHWGWAKSDEYEPNIIRWRPAAPASEATANKEGA